MIKFILEYGLCLRVKQNVLRYIGKVHFNYMRNVAIIKYLCEGH